MEKDNHEMDQIAGYIKPWRGFAILLKNLQSEMQAKTPILLQIFVDRPPLINFALKSETER